MVAALGLGTLGTDLFGSSAANIPDVDTPVTLLTEYGGPPVLTHDAAPGIAYERPRVQVLVRAKDYRLARQRIEGLVQGLARVVNQTVLGARYQRLELVSGPVDVGLDGKGRAQVTANLQAYKGVSP